MFRKGKALGEQGFFDKALVVLEDLKKKNPAGDYTHMFALMISSLIFFQMILW
jgi:propanediol dehydratase large subunit